MNTPSAGHAVVLANLGTPEAPTAAALRPWLAEFLGDPRVVEVRPRWWWRLILHGVILRVRPARSARLYRKIWTPEGSPERVYSERLCTAVADALAAGGKAAPRVVLAMRYGRPALAPVLRRLQAEGVRRLLVLPLYPQYSGASTGSVLDAAADAVKALRWPPELRVVNDYHAHPAWLDALAASIRAFWAEHGRGERLLLSYHGIPQRYADAGDPYPEQCLATSRALAARLELDPGQVLTSFQSRFGREPWLQPYTDALVRALPGQGVRRLDVACPGFAVDCLETLEEIALRNAAWFAEAGGEALRYIPALNASPGHARALAALIRDYTRDWDLRA